MQRRFRDRFEGGAFLAGRLASYRGRSDLLVLALPRGGVPVGYVVAEALGAPLDVFVVRKLGVPGHEEFAMGAIATGGVRVLNDDVIDMGIPQAVIDRVTDAEFVELRRREAAYRGDGPPPELRGKTVILVDDGLATGSTMRAAIAAVRAQAPKKIVVAVPIAAKSTCAELAAEVDEIVCERTPEPFYAVGLWYEDFAQISDEQVHELLARSRVKRGDPRDDTREVTP